MWHESGAQRDGTIRRETGFVASATDLVLSGPHFFVGNPLNKTPRVVCTQNSHYDVLDLISYLMTICRAVITGPLVHRLSSPTAFRAWAGWSRESENRDRRMHTFSFCTVGC